MGEAMHSTRRLSLLAATAALVLGPLAPASAGPAEHRSADANWHLQSGTGAVAGSHASLTVTDAGVAFRWHAVQLNPGHAYTVWVVVVNEPGECLSTPCSAGDVLFNADARADVTYGGGHVVGRSGRSSFGGRVPVGDWPAGWLGNGLTDPRGAEVHLVLNDHGPALSAYLPSMIASYRGGCTDASLPGVFPPTAFADGEPGPNTCRLYQTVIPMP